MGSGGRGGGVGSRESHWGLAEESVVCDWSDARRLKRCGSCIGPPWKGDRNSGLSRRGRAGRKVGRSLVRRMDTSSDASHRLRPAANPLLAQLALSSASHLAGSLLLCAPQKHTPVTLQPDETLLGHWIHAISPLYTNEITVVLLAYLFHNPRTFFFNFFFRKLATLVTVRERCIFSFLLQIHISNKWVYGVRLKQLG